MSVAVPVTLIALTDQWTDTCRAHGNRVPREWQVSECSLCELPAWLSSGEPPQVDAVVALLVQRAQAGDRLAGECLLQALSTRLLQLSRKHPRHRFEDFVTAAWVRIMDYPAANRSTSVLANLAWDSLKSVSREHARLNREQPAARVPEVGPGCSSVAVGSALEPGVEPPPREAAAQIIDYAFRAKLVPMESAAILQSVYRDGLPGKEAARRHHTSEDMIRYRCSSAIRKLRAHKSMLMALIA
jgi:DNA-directed RNA polymerase specialized sigma24 family protein